MAVTNHIKLIYQKGFVMETRKLRITARDDCCRKYAVVFMAVKIAVAFGRDSGAKIGYNVKMISGDIDSGGSRINWYCVVRENSVFELEVDNEFYQKNKNRIKKWQIEEIEEFSISKNRSDELFKMQNEIE